MLCQRLETQIKRNKRANNGVPSTLPLHAPLSSATKTLPKADPKGYIYTNQEILPLTIIVFIPVVSARLNRVFMGIISHLPKKNAFALNKILPIRAGGVYFHLFMFPFQRPAFGRV